MKLSDLLGKQVTMKVTVQTERKLPPLDWDKKTPFDPFEGYEVTKGGNFHEGWPAQHPLSQSPDLQDTGPKPSKIWGAEHA